ncbi:energy-coupling factor transport system ATP-binding protein [Methanolinea mesophila]|uniref:ATP-binding cassette domain-containing protein n=1 Tax=Methanolinea mesophila TaxID=547055 RepID=UPI001AE7DC47|nr:energy-coupling factor ABC transporter ATP-binding protein [Methanolinea mesophila]MBP1929305.1 energy-coupling factor transport system ATP-binding protein [Methanolinea mesophila]
MRVVFEDTGFSRDLFAVRASGSFPEGVHLVSGPVGSGKTTLALAATGLRSPERGKIVREGVTKFTLSQQFPEYHVTGTTLKEEIAGWGIEPDAILEKTGFSGQGSRDPFSLARGELKRVHLACVFAGDWDLLVLDEPFSGLDCREKTRIASEIGLLKAKIVIIFTHEQTIFPRVDRVWEIRDGSLEDLGTFPEAFLQWKGAPPILRTLREKGVIPRNLTGKDLLEAACRM